MTTDRVSRGEAEASWVDAHDARGMIIGDGATQTNVFNSAQPSVRSAYLEQVRRIAPPALVGRERELAELAAFCTDDVGRAYRWWLAAAWAGKSALLSWFVLHPPPGVRVVSFFITARYAGQSDRGAFIEVLVEQLADLLNQSLPALLTEATREHHLLALLAEAAHACQQRGERLVLVVDGLDEDRGVTVGADAYSIAAVLPADPPGGMRIVVAGRPHPPVPSDVPEGHPLRDPDIVRALSPSAHAAVVRADAERELKRLLRGTPAEQDLLGLLTAAGGGLSGEDLSELIGWSLWEVQEHLRAVSGRTFAVRDGRWRPDPGVYVLGHEELQQAATRALGQQRLAGYRQRIHEWIDEYRRRGWPADTPMYAVTVYYQMLTDLPDYGRMRALAIDLRRHDLMCRAGVDSVIATEVASAMATASKHPPDIAALLRLAVRRSDVTGRNPHIPRRLPAAWVLAGQPAKARQLTSLISAPQERTWALIEVAKATATVGDHDDADQLAEEIEDAHWRQVARRRVAVVIAARDPDRAVAIADRITDPYQQAQALAAVARAMVRATTRVGGPDVVRVLAGRVRDLAASLEGDLRDFALGELAEMYAELGQPDEAVALTDQIDDPVFRTLALTDVAVCLATAGETRAAAAAAAAARAAAGQITSPSRQAGGIAAAARAADAAGDHDHAETLISNAEAMARSSDDPYALTDVARAMASMGRADRAAAIRDGIRDHRQADQALADAATATTGDRRHAVELAASIREPVLRAAAMTALAADGRHEATPLLAAAEAVAGEIADPNTRAGLLAELAGVVASSGDQEHAATIAHRAEQLARVAANREGWPAALNTVTVIVDRLANPSRTVAVTGSAGSDPDGPGAGTPARPRSGQASLHQNPATVRHRMDARSLLYDGDEAGWQEMAVWEAMANTMGGSQSVPVQTPGQQARAAMKQAWDGNFGHAEALVHQIDDGEQEDLARGALAIALARDGRHDRAVTMARSCEDSHRRTRALATIAVETARSGDYRYAATAANMITEPRHRWTTLTELVAVATTAGHDDHAAALTAAISDPDSRSAALAWMSMTAAAAGDWHQARAAALPITDTATRDSVLADLAVAAARDGDYAYAGIVTESLTALASDTARDAVALAAAEHADTPDRLAQAERMVRAIKEPTRRAQAMSRLAERLPADQAIPIITEVLLAGAWVAPLEAIARVAPDTLREFADDLRSHIDTIGFGADDRLGGPAAP